MSNEKELQVDALDYDTGGLGDETELTVDALDTLDVGTSSRLEDLAGGDNILDIHDIQLFSIVPVIAYAAADIIKPEGTIMKVAGSGGAVTLTSNPQIADGVHGQVLILQGTSDTNTLKLASGNGVQLKMPIVLRNNDTLTLYFDGTDWLEIARNIYSWDDLRVAATSTKLGGSKDPGFAVFKTDGAGSQGVFVYWFDAGTEEELFFAIQMPHGWDGGIIYPHVHWVPSTTADGTPADQAVLWGLEYTFTEMGGTFGNTATVTGSAHSPADANVVAGKHYTTDLTAITPSASQDGISSMLVCRLYRNAASGTDTYEHDAGLLEFDVHFRKKADGSSEVNTL